MQKRILNIKQEKVDQWVVNSSVNLSLSSTQLHHSPVLFSQSSSAVQYLLEQIMHHLGNN